MGSPDGRGAVKKKKNRKEKDRSKDLQIENLRRELEVTRDRLKNSRSEGKHTQASCSAVVSPDTSDSDSNRRSRGSTKERRSSRRNSESRQSGRHSRHSSHHREGQHGRYEDYLKPKSDHKRTDRHSSRGSVFDRLDKHEDGNGYRDRSQSISRTPYETDMLNMMDRSRSISVSSARSIDDRLAAMRKIFDDGGRRTSPPPAASSLKRSGENEAEEQMDEDPNAGPWNVVVNKPPRGKPSRTAPPSAGATSRRGWWYHKGTMVNSLGETRPLNSLEEKLQQNMRTHGTGPGKRSQSQARHGRTTEPAQQRLKAQSQSVVQTKAQTAETKQDKQEQISTKSG